MAYHEIDDDDDDDELDEQGGRNDAVGLKTYLGGIDAAVKRTPTTWVKCELHVLKVADKFVRMEFVELDGSGRQVARAHGGCFPAVWQRIDAEFRKAGLPLEAGSQVLVKLSAGVTPAYGFNVSVHDIDVTFALGDLNARIQAIRNELRQKGVWDVNHLMRRPRDFVRVAVISPAGAAGLGDFRSTADRLEAAGLTSFTYFEAPFQTRDAPLRIVELLRGIYRESVDPATRYCAVAVIRGGGASTDLAWLIDQKLTEAVCRMNIPVMTGIGHERDRNLLDEVSCIPCDTPSKVAEHISTTVMQAAVAGDRAHEAIIGYARQIVDGAAAGIAEVVNGIDRDSIEQIRLADAAVTAAATGAQPGARALLDEAWSALLQTSGAIRDGARDSREEAGEFVRRIIREIEGSVGGSLNQVDQETGRIVSDVASRLAVVPDELDGVVERLVSATRQDAAMRMQEAQGVVTTLRNETLGDAGRRIEEVAATITFMVETAEIHHPRNVLAAGYALIRDAAGGILTDVEAVRAAGDVDIEMRDGTTKVKAAARKTTKRTNT